MRAFGAKITQGIHELLKLFDALPLCRDFGTKSDQLIHSVLYESDE